MLDNDRLFYEQALEQQAAKLKDHYEDRIRYLQKKRLKSLRFMRAYALTTLIGGVVFIVVLGISGNESLVYFGIISLIIGRGLAYLLMKVDPPSLDDLDYF